MREKINEFSTFDAVRILGIDRSRLVHWMRGEFIPLGKDKPWGRGYKTAFSLFDLYSIALFRECVDFSLSREVAKRYWLYVDWAKVIKEKLWLMAVLKKIKRVFGGYEYGSVVKPEKPDVEMLVEAPKSALSKSIGQKMKEIDYPMLETIPEPGDKGKLPAAETVPKDSFLPQPLKLQTGETLIFKKNFQSLKKAEFKEGGGIMFMIDLKSIIDEVNIWA